MTTPLMRWLRPKTQSSKRRFLAMMESGRLVDEVADIYQTQVIAQKSHASIRNRDPVPLYHQEAEDTDPVWQENVLVETGLETEPGMDSRHVLEDEKNLWDGFRSATLNVDGLNLTRKHMGLIALGASVVVFLLLAWVTVSVGGPDPVQDTKEVVSDDGVVSPEGVVPAGPAPVKRPQRRPVPDCAGTGAAENGQEGTAPEGEAGQNSHGFVETDEAAGQAAGQEGTAPEGEAGGAAGAGGGPGGNPVPVPTGPAGPVSADSVATGSGGDSTQGQP